MLKATASGRTGPRGASSTGRRLVFAALTTAVFLLAVEGVLRVAWPVARSATLPQEMVSAHLQGLPFRYDPDLYWTWADLPSPGNDINVHGFRRSAPMTVEKPEGVTRVIVLGDSQVFGAGVHSDEAFSALAEEKLGSDWEILNAGISGYRSLQIYRLLRLRLGAYDPDAVVVDMWPYDSMRDDGPLAGSLRSADTGEALYRFLFSLRIYRLTGLTVERLRPGGFRRMNQARSDATRDGAGNHDLIADWAHEHGVAPIFMTYPVDRRGVVACLAHPGELPPDTWVVDACDALARTGHGAHELFLDNNHLTPRGHEVVAGALAETLERWAEDPARQ